MDRNIGKIGKIYKTQYNNIVKIIDRNSDGSWRVRRVIKGSDIPLHRNPSIIYETENDFDMELGAFERCQEI